MRSSNGTFWYACRTIVVTQKENESLSFLTSNDQDGYKILVPTDQKYNHLGIKLYEREEMQSPLEVCRPIHNNIIDVPVELLEYEKRYLVA
jgi:hypothetical protein